MELNERLTRVEAIIAEEEGINRLERKGLRFTKFVLMVIALAAPVTWALFEFVMFLINRYESLRHALGQ